MTLPASIFRCVACQCTTAGQPKACSRCGGVSFTNVGPTSSPFDPIAHYHAWRENPEEYVRIMDIVAEVMALRAIRGAATMAELRKEYLLAAKAAKDAGDVDLCKRLEDAKNVRKLALEAQ